MLNFITPRKGKAGAKSETAIITISKKLQFLYDNDEGIFNVHFLIWTSAWKILQFFKLFLCLIVLNYAGVINSCLSIHIFDGFFNV